MMNELLHIDMAELTPEVREILLRLLYENEKLRARVDRLVAQRETMQHLVPGR